MSDKHYTLGVCNDLGVSTLKRELATLRHEHDEWFAGTKEELDRLTAERDELLAMNRAHVIVNRDLRAVTTTLRRERDEALRLLRVCWHEVTSNGPANMTLAKRIRALLDKAKP